MIVARKARIDWDQLYLKQIRYVDFDDKDTGEERFLVSVTFYYEERPDPFSEYRTGFEIRTRKRCKEIVVETHPSRDKRIPRPHLRSDLSR